MIATAGRRLTMMFVLALPFAGWTRDPRTVVEPKIPALRAELLLHAGKLDPADESKLDTLRVQQALDGCGFGRAAELVPGRGDDAFFDRTGGDSGGGDAAGLTRPAGLRCAAGKLWGGERSAEGLPGICK